MAVSPGVPGFSSTRKRIVGDGKRKLTGKWNVQFTDASGIVRRLPGFTDKSATVELERGILRLVSARASGMAPDSEMLRFIEGLPEAIRDRLTEWGILDARRSAAGKPLANLIAAWAQHMETREFSRQHRSESAARVRRIFSDCRFLRVTDVDASKVENWLADRRRDDNMSARTSNSHLASAKAFFGYLIKAGYSTVNPLARIAKTNEAADPRLDRRPFSADEMRDLLAVTETAEKRFGLTGAERALLYTFAAESALRWSELRKLRKRDFDFMENTVSVRASIAKNAKSATLPLSPDTARRLAVHMRDFAPDSPAFPGIWQRRGAAMLHADMAEAGIPVFDEYGRKADFHCLRGTTATLLSDANVSLPTVQQIMRHSNPALTAKHYVRLSVVDKARALEKMPDFHPGKPESESVDTPVDTDRSDKGLFQATNNYKADTIKPAEIDGFMVSKSFKNNELESGGRHWARTSDPQLVELVL